MKIQYKPKGTQFVKNFQYHPESTIKGPNEPLKSITWQTELIWSPKINLYDSKWTIKIHHNYDWPHVIQKFQYYPKSTIMSENEPQKSITR